MKYFDFINSLSLLSILDDISQNAFYSGNSESLALYTLLENENLAKYLKCPL